MIRKWTGAGAALAVLLALAFGCDQARADDSRKTLEPSATPTASPAPRRTIRILAAGDSITAGCNDANGGWCRQLELLLAARGVDVIWGVAAVSGATCGGILDTVRTVMINHDPYQVAILNCGTNNVPNSQASRDQLAAQWRTLVEFMHSQGAFILPTLIQYSDPEINIAAGRAWLVPGEVQANDTLFSQWHYYDDGDWFAGKLDLQQIPGNRDYLNDAPDGIHPNPLGQRTMATLMYRALREHFNLPDDVPQPCGMWGHRPDPAYFQYIHFTPCEQTWP